MGEGKCKPRGNAGNEKKLDECSATAGLWTNGLILFSEFKPAETLKGLTELQLDASLPVWFFFFFGGLVFRGFVKASCLFGGLFCFTFFHSTDLLLLIDNTFSPPSVSLRMSLEICFD